MQRKHIMRSLFALQIAADYYKDRAKGSKSDSSPHALYCEREVKQFEETIKEVEALFNVSDADYESGWEYV